MIGAHSAHTDVAERADKEKVLRAEMQRHRDESATAGRKGACLVATVSARVDDQLKMEAERVADSIGVPLSTAIHVFLKRFAAEGGFPFPVKAAEQRPAVYDAGALEAAVRQAVADPENPGIPPHFTYFDEVQKRPIRIYNRKE